MYIGKLPELLRCTVLVRRMVQRRGVGFIRKCWLPEKTLQGSMDPHLKISSDLREHCFEKDFESICNPSGVYLGHRNGELRVTHHIFTLSPSLLSSVD